MITIATVKGRMIRGRDKPADFKAVNSFFSASDPKAIIDAIKMARGNAKLTNRADAYIINSPMTQGESPFPMRSSA